MSTEKTESAVVFDKALGCLLGGVIGDAMGDPVEGMDYSTIESEHGWVDDFSSGGTDDTLMKVLLCEALIATRGWATLDDWADAWLNHPDVFSGQKRNRFFVSVLHTAAKLRDHAVPRMAALGNMPSSSSAMCIAPVGIVNACNPRIASSQAYNLATLIHVQDVGFCQDGAAAIAAAVAEAFRPESDVGSVLDAAVDFILPRSGTEMKTLISAALALAADSDDYSVFRRSVYDQPDTYLRTIQCDSRETVPLALSMFYLARGDVAKAVTYGANFGRDADTIATIAGSIAGAFAGARSIPARWTEKVRSHSDDDQEKLAEGLVEIAAEKLRAQERAASDLQSILGSE